ncbi:hypothetical protein IV498_09040 [Paenarthrobacter sp. Z7-10]|nr:hypothetical protein [Paenarthrobacter sp. Z7-10]
MLSSHAIPALPSEESGNHAAWADVLARMEAELKASGRLAASSLESGTASEPNFSAQESFWDSGQWTAPHNLGPIPSALVERARGLLAAQQQVVAHLEDAQGRTLRHLAAIAAVPEVRRAGQSVFLDVTG